MPELPEVEAARRAIEEHCIGKKIVKSIIADDNKVIDGVSASDFEASVLGKTILSAHRKGKNLWLRLDSPPFPSFQFGTARINPTQCKKKKKKERERDTFSFFLFFPLVLKTLIMKKKILFLVFNHRVKEIAVL